MKKYLSAAGKAMQSGFTLVELLIVIALLGIIATIVIAAINPIEQANRANDAGMKADASQLISAIERYYASHNYFPWNATGCTGSTNCDSGGTSSPDDSFNTSGAWVSGDDLAVGVCGVTGTGCKGAGATQGELLSALELQSTFLNKSWIGANSVSAKLWVGKAQGASSAVFVCWVPKSNSNRQVLITSATTGANKMFTTLSGFTSAGVPTAGACTDPKDTGWTDGSCVECVPE